MSKTTRSSSNTRSSGHNYDHDHDHATYDDMSDELSGSSSNEDDIVTPRSTKSRKLQPTDAADFEEGGGGMYDRGGRRRRGRRGRRGHSRRRRSRSRSRRRR